MTFYFSISERPDSSNHFTNSGIVTTFFDGKRSSNGSLLNKYSSLPNLRFRYFCIKCQINFNSPSSNRCILCESPAEMMNLSESPCKICSLTPVESYRSYDIIQCDNPPTCKCQRNKSLSLIKSLSCSVAQKTANCDPTIDGQQPKNIRTTASGINNVASSVSAYPNSNYNVWTVKSTTMLPNGTWTCKKCTLLNNSSFTICEACESPYAPDLNSNIKPSVIIKVLSPASSCCDVVF